jgi:hypothetical protein
MKEVFSTIFILVLFISGYAQKGTIRGFVYEEETGEPVIFTNVYLKNTTLGSTTNDNGYFSITDIPPGNYDLMITAMGYENLQEAVTVNPGDMQTRKFFVNTASYEIEGVDVTADRSEAKTETKTSVAKLTPTDIQRIPSVGGQADIAQYMQVLPGVVFTGDQGGQLYIRGGAPIQNKVLLDGLTIYNPFHSIGLFSVFDTDIIRNADVYTGGFGAEYGGRISSIMDITTRDGNKRRTGGKLSANTFGANLSLEGPLRKQTSEGNGSASFILSAKQSYLDKMSESLYSYAGEYGLPFSYTDLYGKVSLNTSNGSKVNFFGFNYTDRVDDYRALSDFQWDAMGAGSSFVIIPGNSPVLIEGYVGYSRYESSMDEVTSYERTSVIDGFNLGVDFLYIKGKNNLEYGLEMNGYTTDFFFVNSVGRRIQQRENTTELGGYFRGKFIFDNWVIEPGMRVQYYASLSELSPEPRLAAKYNASDKLRLKFATGIYAQNLISAHNPRDVVSLFYGFLSGPDNLPSTFEGKEITSKLQHAQHAIVGAEYDVNSRITTNLEVYYKNFSQLTALNRNKIRDEADFPDLPDNLVKDFIVEEGSAYGVDMTMKYDYKGLYLWAVYSHGYVTRNDGLDEYVPHFDRRHNLNLVMNYLFGERKDWEFNARWNLGSGFPFTQTQGAYGLITFEEGIDTDYTTTNESFEIIYGEYNDARLSYYHRLDLGLKKIFFLSEHSRLDVSLSVTNVYDRDNVFFVDRITNERVDQLPIMPSFGFSLTF